MRSSSSRTSNTRSGKATAGELHQEVLLEEAHVPPTHKVTADKHPGLDPGLGDI
jgi:hypothetical protein